MISVCHDNSMSATLLISSTRFLYLRHSYPSKLSGRIRNKAAEIIKTKDAIVTAPGITNGKVAVVVVTVSKLEKLGICAHSIAVAQLCERLPEYVEKFKKTKNLSLSKLPEVTMTKGRGRKGG